MVPSLPQSLDEQAEKGEEEEEKKPTPAPSLQVKVQKSVGFEVTDEKALPQSKGQLMKTMFQDKLKDQIKINIMQRIGEIREGMDQ